MRDHKSLVAWQCAHAVAGDVIDACRDHWRAYASAVFAQLQKASLSVQLNIAEGYALRSNRRFHNHLTIAYGSSVETVDLLELILEKELVPASVIKPTLSTAVRTHKLVLGLLKRYQ